MGFNKRKMEDDRRQEAEKDAPAHRATDRQILEDADHLITVSSSTTCTATSKPGTNDVENGMTRRYAY